MSDDRNSAADPLDARIASAAERSRSGQATIPVAKGYSQGSRVLAELIGAPAGGALIGWLLDRLAGTAPVIMLVMLTLGVVVAFRNILRIANERVE